MLFVLNKVTAGGYDQNNKMSFIWKPYNPLDKINNMHYVFNFHM